jgi:plastocyanin
MRVMCKTIAVCLMTMLLTSGSNAASAADSYTLTIDGQKFEPATLEVKAGEKFKLVLKNTGTTPAEFESEQLSREKVVPPGASVTINLGPLKPGTYAFEDEFHPVAKGQIVAK